MPTMSPRFIFVGVLPADHHVVGQTADALDRHRPVDGLSQVAAGRDDAVVRQDHEVGGTDLLCQFGCPPGRVDLTVVFLDQIHIVEEQRARLMNQFRKCA